MFSANPSVYYRLLLTQAINNYCIFSSATNLMWMQFPASEVFGPPDIHLEVFVLLPLSG